MWPNGGIKSCPFFPKNCPKRRHKKVKLLTVAWKLPRRWRVDLRTVLPDLAKFCYLGKLSKIFCKLLKVYLVFGKILNLRWQLLINFGEIWVVEWSQIMKNNPPIWSHCLQGRFCSYFTIVKRIVNEEEESEPLLLTLTPSDARKNWTFFKKKFLTKKWKCVTWQWPKLEPMSDFRVV